VIKILQLHDSPPLNLTYYIERGDFVAAGAFGEVHRGRWKNVESSLLDEPSALPEVAVKVVTLARKQGVLRSSRLKVIPIGILRVLNDLSLLYF
jgi:hypothetical protein